MARKILKGKVYEPGAKEEGFGQGIFVAFGNLNAIGNIHEETWNAFRPGTFRIGTVRTLLSRFSIIHRQVHQKALEDVWM